MTQASWQLLVVLAKEMVWRMQTIASMTILLMHTDACLHADGIVNHSHAKIRQIAHSSSLLLSFYNIREGYGKVSEIINLRVAISILQLLVQGTRFKQGADEISACLLKSTAPVISMSVAKLFNQCIATGKTPNEWK